MRIRVGLVALRTEAYTSTHRVRILPISRIGVECWHDTAQELEPTIAAAQLQALTELIDLGENPPSAPRAVLTLAVSRRNLASNG